MRIDNKHARGRAVVEVGVRVASAFGLQTVCLDRWLALPAPLPLHSHYTLSRQAGWDTGVSVGRDLPTRASCGRWAACQGVMKCVHIVTNWEGLTRVGGAPRSGAPEKTYGAIYSTHPPEPPPA